jgi:hypothetical protein
MVNDKDAHSFVPVTKRAPLAVLSSPLIAPQIEPGYYSAVIGINHPNYLFVRRRKQ